MHSNLDDIIPTSDPPIIPPTQNMDITSDQTPVTPTLVISQFSYSSLVG